MSCGEGTQATAAGEGPGGPDGVVTGGEGEALDLLRPTSQRLAGWLAHMLKESAFQGGLVALPRAAMRGLVAMLRKAGGRAGAARAAFVVEAYDGFD